MHTRIQIALASSLSNRRFRIETNNWMTRLKRKRTILNPHSLPYIEMNDTVLDRSLLFQAYPAEFVREVLEPTMICQGLREVVKEVDQIGIVLFRNRLRYHETGQMYDAAYLKAVIDWLIETAEQIERVAHQKS